MGEDKVVRDVESYTDNELAVSQIRVLKRIAAAMERQNVLWEEAYKREMDSRAREFSQRVEPEQSVDVDLPVGTVVEAGTGKRVNKLGLDFEKKGRGSK